MSGAEDDRTACRTVPSSAPNRTCGITGSSEGATEASGNKGGSRSPRIATSAPTLYERAVGSSVWTPDSRSARDAESCYEDEPFMASTRLRGRMSVQCSLM